MKKLFLSVAAIVMAAAVFAQEQPATAVVKPTDLVQTRQVKQNETKYTRLNV